MTVSQFPQDSKQSCATFIRAMDRELIAAIADQYLDATGEVWQHIMVLDSLRSTVEARSAVSGSHHRTVRVTFPPRRSCTRTSKHRWHSGSGSVRRSPVPIEAH